MHIYRITGVFRRYYKDWIRDIRIIQKYNYGLLVHSTWPLGLIKAAFCDVITLWREIPETQSRVLAGEL